MSLPVYFIAAFFLGAIPNAYLAGRLLKGIDIRQHGSGNVGATNVFRVLGKGPGSAVFALDFMKGALPVLLLPFFSAASHHPQLMRLAAGLCAVLGHMFTPFLKFKGGKGVASGAGAVCAAFPWLFLVAFVAWVIVFYFSRIVSLSSLASVSALYAAAVYTHPADPWTRRVFLGMLILVFWSHRSNLRRLIKGDEPSFSKTNK